MKTLAPLIAVFALSGAIACAGGGSDPTDILSATPGALSTATTSAVANKSPTPTPSAVPSPIPDLGLVDTVDRGSLDASQFDDLNTRGHYDEIQVADDGTRHLIPLEAIDWGGVAKDGIPSLDNPGYVGPDRWEQMVYNPNGLIIGIEVDGAYRAYPLQILIWHEIVNETFEGKHLLVTY